MPKRKYAMAIFWGLLTLTGISFESEVAKAASLNTQGGKGAKVYCYMRNNGNPHEVSWSASYALLKRQSNSMFKTSPKHAAVMITEAVVQEPNDYPNCGQYLGDLFGGDNTKEQKEERMNTETTQARVEDRYTY